MAPVIKRNPPVAQNLIILMSFPGDHDKIARAGAGNGRLDRRAPIRNDGIASVTIPCRERFRKDFRHRCAGESDFNLTDDFEGVFRAGIVRSDNHQITELGSGLGHQGSFSAIPVSPAAEERD